MTKNELEELKDAYQAVFDENGNVKACGSVACMKLMISLMRFRPKADLGNLDTGVMNINVVKNMYRDIVG